MISLNNLIYLIDFQGHPALGDDHSNNLRYSTLIDICSMQNVDKSKNIIVSTRLDFNQKLSEMRKIAKNHDWVWLEVLDEPVDEFEDDLFDQGYFIDKDRTKIIFGGTNTSGCVFNTKQSSLVNFAKAGYSTELHLPLCAEYHTVGVNASEKNMRAFSIIYEEIKTNPKLLDYINISCITHEDMFRS